MEASGTSGLDFDALGLYPGAAMQLQALADQSQPYHWVKYVGCISKASILTTLPIEDGKGMWIRAGQTFVVRGFNGKYAYAFTAQMLRARADPYAYLHLSWPHSIETQIVRHSTRVGVALPVHVTRWDNSSIETSLIDISISGAMLDSAQELGAAGDRVSVELAVNLDGNAVKLKVAAVVRNVQPKEGGAGFKVGIEFTDVSQNDHLMLNYFIDSISHPG